MIFQIYECYILNKKIIKIESKFKIFEIIVVGLKIVKVENFVFENKMGKKGD